jgi:acetyl-CoA synthetase
MSEQSGIESVLQEDRIFDPPEDFQDRVGGAWVESMEIYRELHRQSIEDGEDFWAAVANELDWFKKWDTVLEWDCPDARWFSGGKINACHNCVDRVINKGFGDELAIIWEGEPMLEDGPEIRRITYRDLKIEVSRFANALKARGVKRGDVVTIYMGMVPELTIAVLACARIGAPHSVIFGGFSPQSIADRVDDADSKVIITCDGSWRRGNVVPLKANVDQALTQTARVTDVIVLQRCHNDIEMQSGRDHWWHELIEAESDECPCEEMASEDMLFLLYTSGSTGKPKGIVHTTGGYLAYTFLTSRYVFNLRSGADHVYWCTADVGWITGHSYIIYGILQNHVPTLMYEGAPNFPEPDRFWDICQRHAVTHFYTAPTAIRAFMKWGDEYPRRHDLSKLIVLGTVGEPINPEAWMWYHRMIGHERCPIVDTWWQTETGGHMITPLPAATPTVPGSCTLPFFGIDAAVVNDEGAEQPTGTGGLLVIRKPWPGMLRGIHGDRQRFIDTYFARVPGMYFAGDSARRDERGYFWIMGRMDDVINVSGHRLGTMEVESALVSHAAVVEAAVVGMPHEIKGTGIAAFCTLGPDWKADDALRAALRSHVAAEIGAIAKPDMIRFTDSLPKTRSGKIMRRLLRDVAAGREAVGDMTTLEDLGVLAKLQADEEA